MTTGASLTDRALEAVGGEPADRIFVRLIRCAACDHVLGAIFANHVFMSIGLRNGKRREVLGDLRFIRGITCEDCGAVWQPARGE